MNGTPIDFIADTSAVIGLLRRDSRVEDKVRDKYFAITFVTLAELTLGVLKSRNPSSAWLRIVEVLHDKHMFHVYQKTPLFYARIYYDLEKRGAMIPINDIWIAALAIETGVPVLARDEHFSRVTGLSVIEC